MTPLGEDSNLKLSVLDDKFWVWETLDEAIRPSVDSLSEDEIIALVRALSANYKGSEDLWDFLITRVHYYGAAPY